MREKTLKVPVAAKDILTNESLKSHFKSLSQKQNGAFEISVNKLEKPNLPFEDSIMSPGKSKGTKHNSIFDRESTHYQNALLFDRKQITKKDVDLRSNERLNQLRVNFQSNARDLKQKEDEMSLS